MMQVTVDQTASLRFQTLISYALKNLSPQHSNAYAIALMCFDGVTPQHLHAALLAKPYITPEGICISWSSNIGRLHRVILSPMTLNLYIQIKDKNYSTFNQSNFDSLYQGLCDSKRSLKNVYASDQLSWLKENTNGPLFAHISDIFPLSGVSSTAYARLDTRLALIGFACSEEDVEADNALSEMIAGFLERNERVDSEKGSVIAASLKKACGLRGNTDAAKKRRMLKECLGLAVIARDYGPTASLLVAWAISLITHGTRDVLAAKTIYDYVYSISTELYKSFNGLDISSLDAAAFQSIYQAIKNSKLSQGGSENKTSTSAMSSFHFFLVYWFDVPASGRLKADKSTEHVPVANVIWAHEVELIITWLDQATCDERLVSIWRIGLLLGSSKRIRIGELFDLRIGDIEFIKDTLVIHVRGQKTKASKRDIVVVDSKLYRLFSEFLDRRKKEFANEGDFIFGDPYKPERFYKFGKLYYGFNTLLKAVTGDRSASFHWLSHSVISYGLTSLLSEGGEKQINPFAQFATDSAHFSIDTTCSEYMHLHHIPIRRILDRALSKINLTSEMVNKWVGVRANTIRKHISNHRLSPQTYYWDLMLHSKVNIESFSNQGDYIETVVPHIPEFLSDKSTLGFEKVFHVLADMVSDQPKESILLKNGINHEEFKSIQNALKSSLQKHGLADDLKLDEHESLAEVDLRVLNRYGFDFESPQNKCKPLFRYFSKLKGHHAIDHLNGCKAWAILKGKLKSSYLSLNEKLHSDLFLSLLKTALLDTTKVAVFYTPHAAQHRLHLRVGEKFITYFGRRPCFYEVKEHKGRPDIYMALSDVQVKPDAAPYGSATSMAGFNAIFLSALVWIGCVSCNL
ncbi:MAG: hypothetical protein ACT6RZ_02070 [Methylophilus sp.]|uniref:hypothetical protein n=1 Tax=Methylophilus sp. TaxID=29541 RepID=UPI00403734E3